MSLDSYQHTRLPGVPDAPLVFALHGTGGEDTQMARLARQLVPDATIVAPRGDVSEGGAARFFRRTGEGVYDMDDLARATAKMAGFVAGHKQTEKAQSVYGIGYSNGANILATILFMRPDLFDRAVLMHPLIPFKPLIEGSLSGKRILITAGRHDPICPPNLTARLEAYLREAGGDVAVEWHPGGHEIRQSELEAARSFLA
ncbi:alpha/beta hydrolase [Pseudaminobacter sp. 19-2017]|uniref:Alpha/beta hydrolase n=1 Tax=Pseudaminobacter soli (ex Zhang et al. 2022) TaxID=2831468 RepID=A0A942DYG2_9HYPH|nr:alpha/beta hydrolase [Pseudaminobacter soli]MBS3650529.1 alpha/beta hydrolase [Pseudaminobacter soli]